MNKIISDIMQTLTLWFYLWMALIATTPFWINSSLGEILAITYLVAQFIIMGLMPFELFGRFGGTFKESPPSISAFLLISIIGFTLFIVLYNLFLLIFN